MNITPFSVGIVVQGPLTDKTIEYAKYYQKYGPVVIGTWSGDIPECGMNIGHWDLDDVKKYFPVRGNVCFQALTSSICEVLPTEFVIKIRSDEYYEDLSLFINKMLNSPEKIISNDIFFTPDRIIKYHPGDHLLGGSKNNMVAMFKNLLDKTEGKNDVVGNFFGYDCGPVTGEIALCLSHLQNKNETLTTKDSIDIMKRNYDVVPISKLGNSTISFRMNGERKFMKVKNLSKTSLEALVGCELIESMDEL